jgi:hypothetical protein
MLPDPLAVTLLVIDALERVGAAYVIGGSLASTIHGVVRTTRYRYPRRPGSSASGAIR